MGDAPRPAGLQSVLGGSTITGDTSFALVQSRDSEGAPEHPVAAAARIASRFALPSPIETFDFPERGNINQNTFLISAGSARSREYILQQINQQVFTRPKNVMSAMIACIEAQRRGLETYRLPRGSEWEAIALVPTREGAPYLHFENLRGESVWRMMAKISGCRTYKSLSEVEGREARLFVAEEAGKGLAIYCDLTAEMETARLENPLPGYRDTRLYYRQLMSILARNRTLEDAEPLLPADPRLRHSTAEHFRLHLSVEEHERRLSHAGVRHCVDLARRNEEFGTRLLRAMETGDIRTVAIHGDTKLDNFLFSSETGRVRALVDLDTIMPHTWLVDWGDMVRSLSNVAGEKERDLSKVGVDLEIYEALARGFLSTARRITRQEIGFMADAVEIIALELGVRFLTDHLRGDNYFKLTGTDPPDLNRVRGMVQLTLFEKLRERTDWCRDCVHRLSGSATR